MIKRRRTRVSPERKKQIIKEILQNGSDLKLLAIKYKLTGKTLSKWRSDYHKAEKQQQLARTAQHFVEVQVRKDIKKSHLKKVELLLDNHSCIIEGRLNSEQLIKFLQILEEASC